jgi:cytochrome P450
MGAVIGAAADRLLQRTATTASMDVVADFASKLASEVLYAVMGLRDEDLGTFADATHRFVALVGNSRGRPADADLDALSAELSELEASVAASARVDSDSMVSLLWHRADFDGALTHSEIVANLMLIFAAGQGTTTSLVSSAVLALLREPDQLQLLRVRPNLIASAVEEVLRLESPIQSVGRTAASGLLIGGAEVSRGQGVVLLIGSANRDELEFSAPDRLDIERRPNRHLAFGRGAHLCLGAALARLEARVALPALFSRIRSPRVAADGAAWQQIPNIRSLSRLDIEFLPVAARPA